MTHGLFFVALKTVGSIRGQARTMGERAGLAAALLAVGFLVWTEISYSDVASAVIAAGAALALAAALIANRREAEGWAFALTGATVVLAVAALFVALYPNVMPSTTNDQFNLTVENASSSHYTLKVMTWVAVIFTPVVIAYQAWTYWVFRERIGRESIPATVPPVTHLPSQAAPRE